MVDVKTNGHQTKGRTAPPLPEITLPDSGITLRIVGSAGPLIQQALGKQLRRERPEPTPPLNSVDYGDGKTKQEPNLSDPDYLKAMDEHQAWMQNEAVERMLNYILDSCIEADVDSAAVERTRKAMGKIGIDLTDVDDRDIYVRYVAMTSQNDLAALQQVFERHTQPTEAVIQEEVSQFRSDVPGT